MRSQLWIVLGLVLVAGLMTAGALVEELNPVAWLVSGALLLMLALAAFWQLRRSRQHPDQDPT